MPRSRQLQVSRKGLSQLLIPDLSPESKFRIRGLFFMRKINARKNPTSMFERRNPSIADAGCSYRQD